MWIKRREYDEMLARALTAQGAKEVLERQVTSQKVTMDWMVLRLTQLEHERAQLIHRYMDVKITVPTVDLDVPVTPETSQIGQSDAIDFSDIGDEAAKRDGLDWNEHGQVTQHGKVIS